MRGSRRCGADDRHADSLPFWAVAIKAPAQSVPATFWLIGVGIAQVRPEGPLSEGRRPGDRAGGGPRSVVAVQRPRHPRRRAGPSHASEGTKKTRRSSNRGGRAGRPRPPPLLWPRRSPWICRAAAESHHEPHQPHERHCVSFVPVATPLHGVSALHVQAIWPHRAHTANFTVQNGLLRLKNRLNSDATPCGALSCSGPTPMAHQWPI